MEDKTHFLEKGVVERSIAKILRTMSDKQKEEGPSIPYEKEINDLLTVEMATSDAVLDARRLSKRLVAHAVDSFTDLPYDEPVIRNVRTVSLLLLENEVRSILASVETDQPAFRFVLLLVAALALLSDLLPHIETAIGRRSQSIRSDNLLLDVDELGSWITELRDLLSLDEVERGKISQRAFSRIWVIKTRTRILAGRIIASHGEKGRAGEEAKPGASRSNVVTKAALSCATAGALTGLFFGPTGGVIGAAMGAIVGGASAMAYSGWTRSRVK